MTKKLLTLMLLLLVILLTVPVNAAENARAHQYDTVRKKPLKPKPAFWKRNKINLFYQQKDYGSINTQKYKQFSVGVMEVEDERMTKFYHKNDKFFQTKLLPTMQLFLQQELEASKMFKEVKLIYEPYDGELTPEEMDFIRKKYDVDMVFICNLTDFQLERGAGKFQLDTLLKEDYFLSPAYMPGMENRISIGGIFQLIFLPEHYVIWSESLDRSVIKYAPKGRLDSKKEMEPIIQNMLYYMMTDMLYLMSEDGKTIKVNY